MDQLVPQFVVSLAERALAFEQQVRLQADWHERTDQRTGRRNGYYPRWLATPYGRLRMRIPRCRQGGGDCSGLFDHYQRRLPDVDRIIRHAYLLGASTRATARLAEQVFGGAFSHQTVSQLMRWLDEQIAAWRQRPIAPIYRVVYIDGMHVRTLDGDRMVMLVTGKQTPEDAPEVLDFCISTGERCKELLADLRRRGLEGVELFVSDDSGAIGGALEAVYPEVPWQSCVFHRLQALRRNVGPTNFREAMLAEASRLFRRPSKLAAEDAARRWAETWRTLAPWAVDQFISGLEDSLMFYNLPQPWWQKVRTNNPLERRIGLLRSRLRLMGCFHDESAVERAVFGQLARWHLLANAPPDEITHNS